MELDHEANQLSIFRENKDDVQNEALYILDEDGIVHELKANNDGTHDCHKKIDFSDHDLTEIIDDDWGRAHINTKAIIYKEIVYMKQSELISGKSVAKKFDWS